MRLLNMLGIGKKRGKMIREALDAGAVIVDVRSELEYRQGHVDGSINIPLDRISQEIDRLKKMNKPILLCCASGMRSASATASLKTKGIECLNGGSWRSLV